MKTKWYGFTDQEEIVYLGEHEDFEGADASADELSNTDTVGACIWLFSRRALEELVKDAQIALSRTVGVVPQPPWAVDEGRCEHGMFRSGAGACPMCGY